MKDSTAQLRKRAQEMQEVYQRFLVELEEIEKQEDAELKKIMEQGDKDELQKLMEKISNI